MSKINMKKTFLLNKGSHVEIDLCPNTDGSMLLTLKIVEAASSVSENESPLMSDLVKPYFIKTIELGFMNDNFSWKEKVSNPQIAYWVELCNKNVGYAVKWEDAELFWNRKYLRQALSRGRNGFGGVREKEKIEACFKM